MTDHTLTRAAVLVDDYLLVWVLAAVAVGLFVPALSVLAPLSTPMLAVMIGSVSLTLAPERFRRVRVRPLLAILVVQTGMPFLAFGLAAAFGLSPALTAGFVVLGAVTPELVTPTMTELGGGDTALATVALVAVGLGTLVLVPGAVSLLLSGTVAVDPRPVVAQLALAVVLPMSLAVAARYRWSDRIARYDDLYPSVSGLAVVFVIGVVTAANAPLVLGGGSRLPLVVAAAIVLNAGGYAAGWVASGPFSRGERIAATLSVGMRDFAVAAALLVGAGFPAAATLPAVVFGVVEMVSSAGLAKWFGRAP